MGSKGKPNISIRCYAYKGKNAGREGYYAVCIDLSLVTWRPTFKAAKQSLYNAICGYIETTIADTSINSIGDFKRVIWRPASFFPYQFQYHIARLFPKLIINENSKQIFENRISPNKFCDSPA